VHIKTYFIENLMKPLAKPKISDLISKKNFSLINYGMQVLIQIDIWTAKGGREKKNYSCPSF